MSAVGRYLSLIVFRLLFFTHSLRRGVKTREDDGGSSRQEGPQQGRKRTGGRGRSEASKRVFACIWLGQTEVWRVKKRKEKKKTRGKEHKKRPKSLRAYWYGNGMVWLQYKTSVSYPNFPPAFSPERQCAAFACETIKSITASG